jgi:hypothetical protein
MMFCPDCNANLDAVPPGAPCPTCGGQRRSAVVHPDTVTAKVSVPDPTVTITRDDHRPWFEKWREVVRTRDQISKVYSERLPSVGNVEVDERVTRFCNECHDMRDWLEGDIGSLAGVTEADITNHARSAASLRISSAVANSHKHHTRASGTTARIRSTRITPQGARVTIEVDWATPAATTVDALDLANDCVASWRQFFANHGISEP